MDPKQESIPDRQTSNLVPTNLAPGAHGGEVRVLENLAAPPLWPSDLSLRLTLLLASGSLHSYFTCTPSSTSWPLHFTTVLSPKLHPLFS